MQFNIGEVHFLRNHSFFPKKLQEIDSHCQRIAGSSNSNIGPHSNIKVAVHPWDWCTSRTLCPKLYLRLYQTSIIWNWAPGYSYQHLHTRMWCFAIVVCSKYFEQVYEALDHWYGVSDVSVSFNLMISGTFGAWTLRRSMTKWRLGIAKGAGKRHSKPSN